MTNIKTKFLTACLVVVTTLVYAEPPQQKSGYELKTALHDIIKGHNRLSYGSGNDSGNNVWWSYRTTDVNPDGTVRDIYTTDCGFNFGYIAPGPPDGYQCGNQRAYECGCYSREHSFPKSWWGGGSSRTDTQYTDIHHLIPADQYVNSVGHSNNALGVVSSPEYKSVIGYKRGANTYPGSPGTTCFEPIDQYKGYFARIYFYMATRYENKIAGWTDEEGAEMINGTSNQVFTDWAKNMLVEWHNDHPVQDWERARNDSVQKIQKNRNPFIDYPELVNKIWGNDNTPFVVSVEKEIISEEVLNAELYPTAEVISIAGVRLRQVAFDKVGATLKQLPQGIYIIRYAHKDGNNFISRKIAN